MVILLNGANGHGGPTEIAHLELCREQGANTRCYLCENVLGTGNELPNEILWKESCAWTVAKHRDWEHRFQEIRVQANSLLYKITQNGEGFDSLDFTNAMLHQRERERSENAQSASWT